MGLYQNRIVVMVGTSRLTNEIGKNDLRSFGRQACARSDAQNGNGSVSDTEIQPEYRLFGDNDMLSAVLSVLCRAKMLVIFSDIDGFFEKASRLHPNAKLIEKADCIDAGVHVLPGGGARRGTGGMKTKPQAAELATAQGMDAIITNGKSPAALYGIIKGENAGTLFARKRVL